MDENDIVGPGLVPEATTNESAAPENISREQEREVTPIETETKSPRSRSRSNSTVSYSGEESSKKKRKSNKKRKRSPSSSDSSISSDGKDTHSGEEGDYIGIKKSKSKKQSKKRFKLYEPTTKNEQYNWELPSELAHYYNKHCRVFVEDTELKEQVKELLPVPSNIRKVPKLDNFMVSTWENQGKHFMADRDGDMVRIQGRIRDVMGPLSQVWNAVEEFRSGETEMGIDPDNMAELLQKSVLLLAQASNSVTYQRRMEALKSVNSKL